ncbi:MAG: hypothetical protein ABI415_08100 [Flavitalea sp.]
MTIDQFVHFEEMEKISAIMQYGHLIAQNADDQSRIFIYRIEKFFVRAAYSRTTDQLEEINCYLEVHKSIQHYRKLLIDVHPAEREYTTPNC